MTIRTLEPYLREHPFFDGLDDAHFALLTSCAKNVVFDANTLIFKQGEPANEFFLIREGRVTIDIPAPAGAHITILTLAAGDILGWSWLMPPYVWQYDARARDRVRALSMDGKCLRAKCDNDPALGYELMKRFSLVMMQRLQAARLQMLDIYGKAETQPR